MLSTELAFSFGVFALVLAMLALWIAAQAVQKAHEANDYARDCTEWMKTYNEKSVVIAKLAEFEGEITMHADLINALRKSMKTLRSRIHMRNLNENGSGEPDPTRDPEGWKRYMNDQLARSKEQ